MSKNPFRICTFLCANETYMSRYKSAIEAYLSEIVKCLSSQGYFFTLKTISNKLFLCWVNWSAVQSNHVVENTVF